MEKRREWPVGVLRKVVGELVHETPSDLLAKSVPMNAPMRPCYSYAHYAT